MIFSLGSMKGVVSGERLIKKYTRWPKIVSHHQIIN